VLAGNTFVRFVGPLASHRKTTALPKQIELAFAYGILFLLLFGFWRFNCFAAF
jgi:hypothetical protein